jgi:phosphoribosyl-ATP pyrophosphohydrolase
MLRQLFVIIESRKTSMPEGSYTASLLTAGEGAILKKIEEETMEVVLAARNEGEQRLVEEIADLFYHTLVLLAARGLHLTAVEDELRRRHRGNNKDSL